MSVNVIHHITINLTLVCNSKCCAQPSDDVDVVHDVDGADDAACHVAEVDNGDVHDVDDVVAIVMILMSH